MYALLTEAIRAEYAGRTGAPDGEPCPTIAQWEARVAECRREAKSARILFGSMLTQIPKVGTDIAEAILNEYPTAHALREGFRRAGSREAARGMLASIKIGTRTVGPAAARSVFDLLFGNSMYTAATG